MSMMISREEVLHEMGLSPVWTLRNERSVLRRTTPVPATRNAGVQQNASPVFSGNQPFAAPSPSPITRTPQPAAADRAGQIAELDWDGLRQSVADCRACTLCAERQQAVLGVGDVTADWLFIGEGPGSEEDARGEPFVGPAGKLLDAMLAAIDLQRGADVYIANAVKCRPPGNRTPEAAEMSACAPYLKRQITLLQPRLIVLLGRAAAHAVLGEDGALGGMRGKSFTYRDGERSIPVLVTYHPAYLLRTLPDKAKAWEDLCRARTLMREAKRSLANGEIASI